MTEHRGIVYIIRHGEQRLYKIGRTSEGSMKRRLTNLQVGNPIELTILGSFTHIDALALEVQIHHLLVKHRVRGEWFSCSLEDIYRAVGKAAMGAPDHQTQKYTKELNDITNGV